MNRLQFIAKINEILKTNTTDYNRLLDEIDGAMSWSRWLHQLLKDGIKKERELKEETFLLKVKIKELETRVSELELDLQGYKDEYDY